MQGKTKDDSSENIVNSPETKAGGGGRSGATGSIQVKRESILTRIGRKINTQTVYCFISNIGKRRKAYEIPWHINNSYQNEPLLKKPKQQLQ